MSDSVQTYMKSSLLGLLTMSSKTVWYYSTKYLCQCSNCSV